MLLVPLTNATNNIYLLVIFSGTNFPIFSGTKWQPFYYTHHSGIRNSDRVQWTWLFFIHKVGSCSSEDLNKMAFHSHIWILGRDGWLPGNLGMAKTLVAWERWTSHVATLNQGRRWKLPSLLGPALGRPVVSLLPDSIGGSRRQPTQTWREGAQTPAIITGIK